MIRFRAGMKRLWGDRRALAPIVASLALGLAGFTTIDLLRTSIDASIAMRGQGLLGGDLGMTARRELMPEEVTAFREAFARLPGSHVLETSVETYTMVTGTQTRLVDVRGVGADYPLYGSLEMRRADGKLEQLGPGAGKELNLPHLTGKSPIWVSPELALQIGAIHGSSVTFGGKPFVVSGIVEDSSLNSWRGFSLAPTVWVSEAALRATGLIRQGSTATSILRGRIGAENAPLLAEQLKSQLAGQWSGKTDLQLVTAQDASARSTTAITYVGDYLGLMTVVGLLLTAIGGSVLYRLRWRKIRYEIAIYRTLGLTNCGVIGLLLLEVTIMSIAAATLAVTLALTGYPVLQRSLSQYLSFTVDLDQFLKTFLTAYTVSWCATVWTALPARLENFG